jgi:Domain of unknown function (DUF4327)
MTQAVISLQTTHPMVKLQRKVRSLVDSKVMKQNDSLWKLSFLYGDDWGHWKQELIAFGFSMQDPVGELLSVEAWDED